MLYKNDKVLIMANTKLKGLVGTVAFQSSQSIKVEVPQNGFVWFSEGLLRHIKSEAPFTAFDEGVPVKVVVERDYSTKGTLGKSGYVSWQDDGCMTVDIDGAHAYVEAGDVIPLPREKTAWVVEREQVTQHDLRFETIKQGYAMWLDENGYMVSDKRVFDDFLEAIDAFTEQEGQHDIVKVRK